MNYSASESKRSRRAFAFHYFHRTISLNEDDASLVAGLRTTDAAAGVLKQSKAHVFHQPVLGRLFSVTHKGT